MPAGLFFVAVALFQLIWARAVLARTTIPVLAAGIMLNLGAIALWALSRTAGAPFGPNAGEAEVVQAADLCALLLQVYVVMGAAWVWYAACKESRYRCSAARWSSWAQSVSWRWRPQWELLQVCGTVITLQQAQPVVTMGRPPRLQMVTTTALAPSRRRVVIVGRVPSMPMATMAVVQSRSSRRR